SPAAECPARAHPPSASPTWSLLLIAVRDRASGAPGRLACVRPPPPAPGPERSPAGLEALVAAADVLGGRHHLSRGEGLREALPEERLAHRMVIHDDTAPRLADEAHQVVDPSLHEVVAHLTLEVGRRPRDIDEIRALPEEVRGGDGRGRSLEIGRVDEPRSVV